MLERCITLIWGLVLYRRVVVIEKSWYGIRTLTSDTVD